MDVILVDNKDNEIGRQEKIDAHKQGNLHRAFSIFIFNNKNELLLQKRSDKKYHSANLWSNTCCSHPTSDNLIDDARLRLKEEFGFTCKLQNMFSFIYKVNFNNGLIENEYDHVLFGKFDDKVYPNENEISDYEWISLNDLKKNIEHNPDDYSHWLKKILNKVIEINSTYF
jgi:isopentenyl-diphosphate Delta-isomerase